MIDLRELAARYGLDDLDVVDDMAGWGNHLRLRCRTADGRDVFVKEKAPYLTDDEWPMHLSVQDVSMRAGGPVPRLLTTVDGALGVAVDGHLLEVQEWVDGRLLCATEPDARQLGRAIALFHLSTAAMRPGSFEVPACRDHWFPDDVPTLLNAITRHCRPRLRGSTPELKTLDALTHAVTRLGRDDPPAGLINAHLHGDTALRNAVLATDGSAVLIDLDDARWGKRLFDLTHAVAVAATVVHDQLGSPAIRNRWDEPVATAVVAGYNEVSPLTDDETRLLGSSLTIATVAVGVSELELDDPEFAVQEDLAEQLENIASLLRDIPSVTAAVEPLRSKKSTGRKEVRNA
jgi:Ser/Thr protein kinase RdoA (MazF antagonist)